MELARLIEALSDPDAYPAAAAAVEVRQTHISVVFLAGSYVYKIKKPVDLGFLDFTTLAKRQHFCQEEVRLNRRLAAEVYLGVVPIAQGAAGLAVEGAGPVVEWAVKMQRLSDHATLEHRLDRGELGGDVIEALAARVAAFHSGAERGESIARFGRYEVVERNIRENFEQAASGIGTTVSREVFDALEHHSAAALAGHRELIEERAARGVPCDTHGDLRLGHVYWFPDRPPPADLVVIDCIEFNERFRFADPVADMAFLVMGLARAGRQDLADQFARAYFRASLDEQGRALVPLYVSYRAAVRAKVDGIQSAEAEIPADLRALALSKARGFWLLALGALERLGRRPCLVLVGGLPGVGKSTLAVDLAERSGFGVIRSDLVRKELAGAAPRASHAADFEAGIYAPEWTERTYAECRRRAEAQLFEGKRVIVDASFRDDDQRRGFLDAATHWGVPGLLLVCQAQPDVVRRRLAERRGDASDADWPVYLRAAERWQQPGPAVLRATTLIDTSAGREPALAAAIAALHDRGLHE